MSRYKLLLIALLSLVCMAPYSGRPLRDQDTQVVGAAGGYTACNVNLWTDWQLVHNKGAVHFKIDFIDTGSDATTTAINMRCETESDSTVADDAGRDLPGLDGGTFAAGPPATLTLTAGQAIWTWPTAAGAPNSTRFTLTVRNIPDNYINCLFTCTGGDADDDIRVYFSGESP